MDSFDDLGLAPELTEALATEGIDVPTPLQEVAIPLLARGNNAILTAGPGSGLLVAWAAPLLERVEASGISPRLLALTSSRETAEHLAEAVARLAQTTGHSVAALGSRWVLADRAQILFGTPDDVLAARTERGVALDAVEALVVDQAQLVETFLGLGGIERILDFVPPEAQRILSALPLTPGVTDLAERHFKRAMTLPPPSLDAPARGDVRFRIVPEPREASLITLVDQLLEEGARHVLVFTRCDDRAADVGDELTLHGYVAGAPGDTDVPVWLGVDALAARAAARGVEGVRVVSCDAPADPDSLDRRHSIAAGGVVLVVPREVAHLRDLAKRTGYTVVPFPPPAQDEEGAVQGLRRMLERALEAEDTAPYLLALEPLFERYDPAEVAAAATALLRRKEGAAATAAVEPAVPRREASVATPAAWAKLFISVGTRDGLKAGDLLGAITGEAGVPGESVGRIDIKESHSLVEVHDDVARRVIKAINGTTLKGRAVRADFDRPRRGGSAGRKPPQRA